MKIGRKALKKGQVTSEKRKVTVGQIDFDFLQRCYREDVGDAQASIYDASGKLSSKVITQLLQRCIFFCSEEEEEGEKGGVQPQPWRRRSQMSWILSMIPFSSTPWPCAV